MAYRLGVDVGGTFTDLALFNVETNRLEFAKTPSIIGNQADGVAQGARDLLRDMEVSPREVDFFIHGTTVATNALLERRGARTALVVTAGFRDILQIGRQDRPHLYDWRIRRPAPLVPRHLRFEVRERVLYTGEIDTSLDRGDVETLLEELRDARVQAIAVCLLHSYANPEHERVLGEALRDALPEVTLSLSHEILPEFKEYERMSTTTINAYVAPVMERYLRDLETEVSDLGITAPVHVMQSNGGTMGASAGAEKPVHTILSGPAAGVIGSVALANQAGESNTISVDMGGTSFDVSLSFGGEVRSTKESEIDRLPVKVPMVDIHTLGAGGGSVAWIDPGGALRVGPQSAGADPGPAAYGRGGEEPTVTDANLVLRRLDPERFLGGRMTLHSELAVRAVSKRIAEPLGMSVEAAAEGIIRVVNAGMIKGIRVVSVSKGYDPRDFCLVAFGGAGPLHAAELATELDIPRVLVPLAPGVTSALGLLMADLRHDYVRTVLARGDDINAEKLDGLFTEMETEAVIWMSDEGVERDSVTLVRLAEVRYQGQGYELEVPVSNGIVTESEIKRIIRRFHESHKSRYGHASPENPVEVVNLRVTALSELPRPTLEAAVLEGTVGAPSSLVSEREVYFDGVYVATKVYDRSLLSPGDIVKGPAIVEQLDSTAVVWPGEVVRVDAYANLILEREVL